MTAMHRHGADVGLGHRIVFLVTLWLFVWALFVIGVPRVAGVIDQVRAVRVVLVPLVTLGIISLIVAACSTTLRLTGARAWLRRRPAAIRRLAGTGAFAAALVLTAEVALRLTGYPPHPYRADPQTLVFVRGNYDGTFRTADFVMHVTTDGQGLRNPPPPGAATARHRVLVVGDSITFGWGVNNDQTFVALLQQKLRGEGTAVMGAAMPGLGTAQETMLVRRFAPEFHPDVVVLSFTLNDYLDNAHLQQLYPIENGRVVSLVRISRLRRFRLWIRHHVLVVNPVWDFITEKRGKGIDKAASFREFASLLFQPAQAVEADPRYQLTLRYIDAFAAEARAYGAAPVIMINGDRHVAVQKDMERLRAESAAPGAARDGTAVVTTLAADLRARGLAVVDTTPAFRAAAAQAPLYFKYHSDDHWTARGHQVAAEVLAQELCAGLLRGMNCPGR
jgi:lysophospholipase L1-like esterase